MTIVLRGFEEVQKRLILYIRVVTNSFEQADSKFVFRVVIG